MLDTSHYLESYANRNHKKVDGWLEKNTILQLLRINDIQNKLGISGHVGEIGVHHGKLFILLYRKMPFSPRLKGTLFRALAACISGVGLSVFLQNLVGTQTSTLANLGVTSGILILSGGIILPWLLPEIKDLLNI